MFEKKNLIVATIISVLAFIIGIVIAPVMPVLGILVIIVSLLVALFFIGSLVKGIANEDDDNDEYDEDQEDDVVSRPYVVHTRTFWGDIVIVLTLLGVIIIIALLLFKGCDNEIDELNVKNLNVETSNVTTETVTNQEVETQNVDISTVDEQDVTTQNVETQDVSTSNVTEQNVTNQEVETQDVSTSNVTEQNVTNQEVETQNVTTSNVEEQKVTEQKVETQNVTTSNVANQGTSAGSKTEVSKAPTSNGKTEEPKAPTSDDKTEESEQPEESEEPKPNDSETQTEEKHTCTVCNTNKTDATCTETGKTVETCSCGKTINETVIPAKGHSWDSGKVTTKATEKEQGVKTYTCTVCGETKTESIEKLEHVCSVADSIHTDATCTEKGSVVEVCSCGKTISTLDVPAKGHNWNSGKVTTKATEKKEGVKTYTCTTCGETKTESIEKLAHTCKVADYIQTQATCTSNGVTQEICSCGKVLSYTQILATGHDWNRGEITREATENRTGIKTYTCRDCGKTKTETIDKLEHVCEVSDEEIISPTCTTNGKIKYLCDCGKVLDTEVLVKFGHSYKVISEKEATATTDGYIKYRCERCEDTYTDTIPATGEEPEEPEQPEQPEEPEEPIVVKLSANSFVISDGKTIKITTTGKASDLKLQQSMDQLKMKVLNDNQVELSVKTPGVGGTVTVYDKNTGASIEITIEFVYD